MLRAAHRRLRGAAGRASGWVGLLLLLHAGPTATAESVAWRDVDAGLQVADIRAPVPSPRGDSRITVVRIDPRRYAFKLLTAKEYGGARLTVRQWARTHGLVAAINAGMYQEDGLTSVGYMKNFAHVNNPHVNPNNAVLAFNPADPDVPEVQIIDRACQDFAALRGRYHTLIQSIRMVSCDGRNVWSPQDRRWSIAAVAVDGGGRVLFIHSRSPYPVHDFVNILLRLPLDIRNAMYLEGGPKAALYLSANGIEIERLGRFDSALLETNANAHGLPVPNVLGVVPKAAR